jgi:hypothetical protein
MGFEVDREAPWYFTKPANALALAGMTIPYPPGESLCPLSFPPDIPPEQKRRNLCRKLDDVHQLPLRFRIHRDVTGGSCQ